MGANTVAKMVPQEAIDAIALAYSNPEILARFLDNQLYEFYELQALSGCKPDEIMRHLAHFSGSLRDLRLFYQIRGCFPSEVKQTDSSATEQSGG